MSNPYLFNTAAAPLKVVGRYLVDGNGTGNRWKMAGINWAGAHQDNMVPGGLDQVVGGTSVTAASIAAQLVSWGFNHVRFPFSGTTINSTTPINPLYFNAANQSAFAAWLAGPGSGIPTASLGMTPWNVYQYCVYELTQAGLAVIPNYHLLYKGWCCDANDTNGLWWNNNNSFALFTANWSTVVTAFASNPLVIGYDIKNEPRPALISGKWLYPTWGNNNQQTDFLWMYNQLATTIQTIQPNALLFCEQVIAKDGFGHFITRPVTPKTFTSTTGTVVYSSHQYPFGLTSKYKATQASFNGNLLTGNSGLGVLTADSHQAAPFWMGELGMINTSTSLLGAGPGTNALPPGAQSAAGEYPGAGGGNVGARLWWELMQNFLMEYDVDWCWWHLSGTHVAGTTPGTNVLQYQLGDHCWDGIYSASWNGPSNPVLLAQVQALMPATLGPGTPY